MDNQAQQTLSDMVKEFHEKQGIKEQEFLNDLNCVDRFLGMEEEWHEMTEALFFDNKTKLAHELADLMYTIVGTALVFGIEIEPVFAEVHKANMTKGPGFDKSTYISPEIKV